MWLIAFPATAVFLAAGFLSSWLPGLGIGLLHDARLWVSTSRGARARSLALIGVMRIVFWMTVSGVLRLIVLAVGVAMIAAEHMTYPPQIDEYEKKEVTNG
jgi:hypothetical protein